MPRFKPYDLVRETLDGSFDTAQCLTCRARWENSAYSTAPLDHAALFGHDLLLTRRVGYRYATAPREQAAEDRLFREQDRRARSEVREHRQGELDWLTLEDCEHASWCETCGQQGNAGAGWAAQHAGRNKHVTRYSANTFRKVSPRGNVSAPTTTRSTVTTTSTTR